MEMERVKLVVESLEDNGVALKLVDLDCPIKIVEICRRNNKLEVIYYSEYVSRKEIKKCLAIAKEILLGPNYRKRGD